MVNSMRTLAIGGIHGCRDALENIWKAIAPQPDNRIIFMAD